MRQIERFSRKQLLVLTWWCGRHRDRQAIICDGAVRSGKTFSLSLSFLFWAFCRFDRQNFAFCGKTVSGLRRNLLAPLLSVLPALGFESRSCLSRNLVTIRYRGKENTFHLFGGRDESSASLIQGMTLAGVLLDEVALMPRSFVEQALARCSVEGARFFFNCNPEHPSHWFYREWICRAQEKNALYLHFRMEDNPSLSPAVRQRYASLYSGPFYRRFVLGEWNAPTGVVYPMFSPQRHLVDQIPDSLTRFYISCDYGITNPASFGLWGCDGKKACRIREYYFDSHREQCHRTDEEYYRELERLAGEYPVQAVVVDPSATSFLECIRRHGRFRVIPAVNRVREGINQVACALERGQLLFSRQCVDTIREFSLYRWEENRDSVRKEHDHAMDDIRYFVSTVFQPQEDGFFVRSQSRDNTTALEASSQGERRF